MISLDTSGKKISYKLEIYTKGEKHSCNSECDFTFNEGYSPYVRAIIPN